MKNLRKVSRTLLIATVMSGVVVIAGKIPAIENYSGQYAKAQELGVSSQSRTAAAAAARAARPKIRSVPSTGERAGKILVKAQEYISEEKMGYNAIPYQFTSEKYDEVRLISTGYSKKFNKGFIYFKQTEKGDDYGSGISIYVKQIKKEKYTIYNYGFYCYFTFQKVIYLF